MRYRTAALVCFSFAVLIYTVIGVIRMSPEASKRIASLGMAWWLVGCAMVPFAAYYAWRRAQLDRVD